MVLPIGPVRRGGGSLATGVKVSFPAIFIINKGGGKSDSRFQIRSPQPIQPVPYSFCSVPRKIRPIDYKSILEFQTMKKWSELSLPLSLDES